MNISCQEAGQYLRDHDGYLLLTHRCPDGDAVGCAVALCLALRRLGKTVFVLPNPDATALFDPYWGDTRAGEGFEPACVVTVDLASEGLFPANAEGYKGRVDLCIDHHGSNTLYAARSCVEGDKAACGEIIYNIVKEWGPVDAALALPLYLALATDTGCFLYGNTTPHTHRVAAALLETGIDFAAVNKRHFRTKSYTRLRLEGRIIETLERHDGGKIALAAVSLADRRELGVTDEDMEDISSFVGQLAGVETAVTIREEPTGECHLSVRTGPGLNASQVCALFGGGGHAGAAGCNIPGTVADARTAILKAIRQVQTQ